MAGIAYLTARTDFIIHQKNSSRLPVVVVLSQYARALRWQLPCAPRTYLSMVTEQQATLDSAQPSLVRYCKDAFQSQSARYRQNLDQLCLTAECLRDVGGAKGSGHLGAPVSTPQHCWLARAFRGRWL